MEAEFKIIDDSKEGRIAVEIENQEIGFIKFKWLENGNINAYSTFVKEEFRDLKLGMPLFDKLIEFAKEKDIKIFPTCPFVVKMFKRLPELGYLLDPDYEG